MKPVAICGIGAVLAIAGGGGFSEPAAAQQALVQPQVRQSNGGTLDEQLLDVARQDPAFGGMFFDNEGRLTMYVLKSALAAPDGFSRLAGLSVGVESAFRGHDMMEAAARQRINVLPAEYSFVDLYNWHETVKSDVLTVPGVVLTDIAEDQNRLRVGVETAEVAAHVREQLASRGVPSEAVSIELTTPIRRLATVRNRFRPLVGGLQINFSYYLCTLGFMAVRAGVPGMVTNSHCTATEGRNNNTIFYQPLAVDDTYRIGIETTDPAFFTGGACPSRKKCRYSDSAFVRIPHTSGPSVTATRGAIAKPVALDAIGLTTGRFRITSENSTPMLYETLHKVGRTTGWTKGKVVLTYVDTNVSGTNVMQLCQDIVKANVAGGDSGSPVFRINNSPSRDDVRLYGLLWGGGTIPSLGTVFVFSALGTGNLQRSTELGRLTTCASGFGC